MREQPRSRRVPLRGFIALLFYYNHKQEMVKKVIQIRGKNNTIEELYNNRQFKGQHDLRTG